MRHNMGLGINPCNKGEISKLPKKIKTTSKICDITQVLYLVSVASDMSKLAQFLRYPAASVAPLAKTTPPYQTPPHHTEEGIPDRT